MYRKQNLASMAVMLTMCALACVGCSRRSVKDHMPPAAAAEKAVVTALTAWQAGKPPGVLEPEQPDSPTVHAVDSEWLAGKKRLAKFEAVEQLPNADGPPKFKVRLTYQQSSETIEAIYFVVGKNPLLVYRDADFETKATGM